MINRMAAGQASTNMGAPTSPSSAETGGGNNKAGKLERRQGRQGEERAKKRELKDKKRAEVIERVKSGEDKEGRVLWDTCREAVTTEAGKRAQSSKIRDINKVYRQARRSRENLDHPGEADKLIASMEGLYAQVGFDKYELKIEINEEDLPEEEEARREFKARLVREKLEKDFDGFLDRALEEHLMKQYLDKRTDVEVARDRIGEIVTKEDVSRSEVRREAYKLEREENRLESVELRMLEKLGGTYEQYVARKQAQRERRNYEEVKFERVDKLDADKQRGLIETRIEAERKALEEGQGANAVEAYDKLGNKEELTTRLLNTELEINNARKNLEQAVATGKAGLICARAAKVKQLELEHQANQTEMEAAMAGQRRVNSINKWSRARKELAESFVKLKGGGREAAGNLVAASKEVVAAHVGYAKERLEKIFSPVARKLEQGKQAAGDAFSQLVNEVDEQTLEWAKDQTAAIEVAARETYEAAAARAARINAEAVRHKVDAQRWYYRRRHGGRLAVEKALFQIATRREANKKHLGVKIGKFLGWGVFGEEQEKRLRRRHKAIERLRDWELSDKEKELREKRAQNPHLDKMIDRLAERAIRVVEDEGGEAGETASSVETPTDEPEVEESPTPAEEASKPKTEEEEAGVGGDETAETESKTKRLAELQAKLAGLETRKEEAKRRLLDTPTAEITPEIREAYQKALEEHNEISLQIRKLQE